MRAFCLRTSAVLACAIVPFLSVVAQAEDWVVAKATGQVWHAQANAQPVALGAETKVLPGDLVQTGPSGRVLLTRGSERILVAPNSVVSLPKAEDKPGFTTILQQAGSIAIEAEKKDHKHFEVLTPYLAAVVKGTQFTVSVRNGVADVNVQSGKVEVANLKSGRTALVLPGQFAHVGQGAGLTLGGKGSLEPITQGQPRASTLSPVQVPKGGLQRPINVNGSQRADRAHVVRIEKALGPMTLDVGRATAGLVRSEGSAGNAPTIWKAAAAPSTAGGNPGKSATVNAGNPAAPGLAGTAPGLSGATPANGNPGNGVGNSFGPTGNNGVGPGFGVNGGNGLALGKQKKN